MAKNETSSSGGIGFLGVLGLIFITLKLMGFIDWSWWWVTAPLWGGAILAVVVFLGIVVWVAVAEVLDDLARKNRG